jgi:sugar lactone lactonase YvrE
MTVRFSRRGILGAVGAGALGASVVGGVPVAGKPGSGGTETLFTYDPSLGELPENVAIDRRGTKYVSFPQLGEIRRITPDNEHASTLATFSVDPTTDFGVLGLEVDPTGTLFACVATSSPSSDTNGVWSVEPGDPPVPFAPLPPGTLPNDILLDGHSLLVTDSIGETAPDSDEQIGRIWRVSEDGAEVWVADALLGGLGEFPGFPPLGANGIVRTKDGSVVVANTEKGQLVRIPVNPDGSAGTPELLVADGRLVASDGLAVDTRDNVYVGLIGQNTVVRVAPDESIETLAGPADGLDGPSDVTFGTARGEQKDLFITNFALLNENDPKPSLMKLDVGIPGAPIRR